MSSYKLQNKEIRSKIYMIRNRRIMIDRDLALLYAIPTKHLNRQVKRNIKRFPEDFMFRLTKEEFQRYQIGTFGTDHQGSRKYLPYAFTDYGILMLSSVLNSDRAIQVNIQIMRTFSNLKQMLAHNKDLREKIEDMEKKYDRQFKVVFDALRELLQPPPKPKHKIGFHP